MKITVLLFAVLICCFQTAAYAAPPPAFVPEKGKTALIVVDMQNDFVRDGGILQTKAAKATLGANKKLIDYFHANKMPVIYTRLVDVNDNQRVRLMKVGRPDALKANAIVPGFKRFYPDVQKELDSADVVDEIYPAKGDTVIDKDLFDAFQGTNLDITLKANGIRTVLVTGTVTQICVDSTGKGAFNNGYNAVLISDAISTDASEPYVKELLTNFGRLWGRVMTSDQAIQELSR
ncbi:MAG TPA: isochorismatase family cysteine hydrolase [Syntrophorhabdales bacterium]|nr:isochorismatase family cysteine hydrolase [Syntrophorhabdales bacterium]